MEACTPGDAENVGTQKPSKHAWEKQKSIILQQIVAVEERLRGCHVVDPSEQVGLLECARTKLREQYEHTDGQLRTLATRITEVRHGSFRLRDKLKYRTERQVDDAVRRLETQLQTRHYKRRDEEKIVHEINELNKSKHAIRDYDIKKRELEALSVQQRTLRQERDRLFGYLDKSKREEDALLKQVAASKDDKSRLEEELEELRARLVDEENSYRYDLAVWQRGQVQDSSDGCTVTVPSLSTSTNSQVQRAACSAPAVQQRYVPDPHQLQLLACQQLLVYLTRLLAASPAAVAPAEGNSLAVTPSSSGACTPLSPCTPVLHPDGGPVMFVLPKKEDTTPSMSTRSKKRRERRGSQRSRPLTHSAEVFHQFCLLDVSPPANCRELPTAFEHVKAKQRYYQLSSAQLKRDSAAASTPNTKPPCPPLSLRLRPRSAPSPPASSSELVCLHSIGVALPYDLIVAPPASVFSLTQHGFDFGIGGADAPPSRDSGVPSAPASAEVLESDSDPFATALLSRLRLDDDGQLKSS